jgi:hypothetical protein
MDKLFYQFLSVQEKYRDRDWIRADLKDAGATKADLEWLGYDDYEGNVNMATVQYKIFQLGKITCYSFMGWKYAKDNGFSFEDYEEVYSGEIVQKHCLDELFRIFNIESPDDFTGHSLSVSDVIAIKTERNDYWYYYYCDSFGWQEVTAEIKERDAK